MGGCRLSTRGASPPSVGVEISLAMYYNITIFIIFLPGGTSPSSKDQERLLAMNPMMLLERSNNSVSITLLLYLYSHKLRYSILVTDCTRRVMKKRCHSNNV